MIHYLKHNEIDFQKWDGCLASSPAGLVYAFTWYLDIVSPGWEALVKGDYEFVLPLTCRKKAGIEYLFQPYFTQQLGVFGKDEPVSEKMFLDFMNCIPEKFKLIEIQVNESNKTDLLNGFTLDKRLTHYLNLAASYDLISKHYSENLRRNLKKATSRKLNISTVQSCQSIIHLFRENKGKDIGNIKEKDYENLENLIRVAQEKKSVECIQVIGDGTLLAGAIFMKSIHSYIFLFSALSSEGKNAGAMSLLIDNFIRQHSGENKVLDFEGSMNPSLSRFYKSFGSKEIVYLQIRRNKLPLPLRWLK